MLETIEKNRFNLKKSAEFLKLSEFDLYKNLLCIPVVKIEKMSRIDAETDAEEIRNGISKQTDKDEEIIANGVEDEEMEEEKDFVKMFLEKKKNLGEE